MLHYPCVGRTHPFVKKVNTTPSIMKPLESTTQEENNKNMSPSKFLCQRPSSKAVRHDICSSFPSALVTEPTSSNIHMAMRWFPSVYPFVTSVSFASLLYQVATLLASELYSCDLVDGKMTTISPRNSCRFGVRRFNSHRHEHIKQEQNLHGLSFVGRS